MHIVWVLMIMAELVQSKNTYPCTHDAIFNVCCFCQSAPWNFSENDVHNICNDCMKVTRSFSNHCFPVVLINDTLQSRLNNFLSFFVISSSEIEPVSIMCSNNTINLGVKRALTLSTMISFRGKEITCPRMTSSLFGKCELKHNSDTNCL